MEPTVVVESRPEDWVVLWTMRCRVKFKVKVNTKITWALQNNNTFLFYFNYDIYPNSRLLVENINNLWYRFVLNKIIF